MRKRPAPLQPVREAAVERLEEAVCTLAEQIVAAGGSTVFFTGAGISTESVIPDFRSPGGIWSTYKPVLFDDFMASREARIEYWRQKAAFSALMEQAQPNAGHAAIARLYAAGLVRAVITQNIDGMHQASGMPGDAVIELHGNASRVRCMSCSKVSSLEEAFSRIRAGDPAPECPCGGYLKPDTISFGQAMPEREVRAAVELARTARCFVVVGSTLVVHPAASIPVYAHDAGAFLAIVNLSDTPCDDLCSLLIREKAGRALGLLVAALEKDV
jgi:NAD-dependent deacetylase